MNSFVAYLAACMLTLELSCASALANDHTRYRVRLLGCELPIPTQYVLDATGDDSIELIHEGGMGHIWIAEFEGIPDRFEVISERTEGRLTVSEVVINTEGRALDSFILIRDQEDVISLFGDAKTLAPGFLEACVERE